MQIDGRRAAVLRARPRARPRAGCSLWSVHEVESQPGGVAVPRSGRWLQRICTRLPVGCSAQGKTIQVV